MSANQIPGVYVKDPRKKTHDCPGCWRNGGPGHSYAALRTVKVLSTPMGKVA